MFILEHCHTKPLSDKGLDGYSNFIDWYLVPGNCKLYLNEVYTVNLSLTELNMLVYRIKIYPCLDKSLLAPFWIGHAITANDWSPTNYFFNFFF